MRVVAWSRDIEPNCLPLAKCAAIETGDCCPPFDPNTWDKLALHFRDKLFVHARTRSFAHIPINMKNVFARTWETIKAAGAEDIEIAVLTDDESLWRSHHYFPVSKEVPGLDNVRISGDFITRVFEGPYRDAYIWVGEMREDIAALGHTMGRLFFYYTTCPRCAERRRKNYVVAVAEVV